MFIGYSKATSTHVKIIGNLGVVKGATYTFEYKQENNIIFYIVNQLAPTQIVWIFYAFKSTCILYHTCMPCISPYNYVFVNYDVLKYHSVEIKLNIVFYNAIYRQK